MKCMFRFFKKPRSIILSLGFLENKAKVGSDAAKLIGDDSISDVENTAWHLKLTKEPNFEHFKPMFILGTTSGEQYLKYSNRLPPIIALSQKIASYWCENNNNRPRPLFEEIR